MSGNFFYFLDANDEKAVFLCNKQLEYIGLAR